MTENDLMPARMQPRNTTLVLMLLVILGGLFVFLHKGQQVSRQAETAVVTQGDQSARLRQVDPALVKWREVKRLPIEAQATCLAVAPNGDVYVGAAQALSIARTGEAAPTAVPLAFAPLSVAVGQDVYVAAQTAVYVRQGEEWRTVTPDLGTRAYVSAVVPAQDGLWIANSGNRQVLHLDKAGKILGTIGKGQLTTPSAHLKIAVKPDGDLLINNPGKLRVDTYSPTGALKNSFGKAGVDISGFCGCCNPIDVALLPDGKIVTAEKGLPRVKVYGADGTLESVVAAPKDLSAQCQPQIAVNKQGQILVLDPPARLVRVFERKP